MNLYELQEQLRKKFPEENISLRFTEECKKGYDVPMIDGKPSMFAHCVYTKVIVEVGEQPAQLVNIAPHRQQVSFLDIKAKMASFAEPAIPQRFYEELLEKSEEERVGSLQYVSNATGISVEDITSRFTTFQQENSIKKEIPIVME